MKEIIASFDCHHSEIPTACADVFHLGLKIIEKEYNTAIYCYICVDSQNKKAELQLHDVMKQHWFFDPQLKDIITYKLSTHLKICLDQFNAAPREA